MTSSPGGGAGAGSVTAAEVAGLLRAVELAARGAGSVLPNPVVGCVLLGPGGAVVGEGFHERAGGPHAEVVALAVAGEKARGATALVTLEPCRHTGRTGPCTQALIAAGVSRVVVAAADPTSAAGGGLADLAAAGVQTVAPAAVPAEAVAAAREVNRVWLAAAARRRPFVTLKLATTIDGRVAAVDGTSRWISSAESRADAHLLRERVDTMMVGVGTVLADDPLLTARRPDGTPADRQPLRVVVDSGGRTPAGAAVRGTEAETLIATAAEFGAGADGRVDLTALLEALYARGRRHILLEGGPRLAAAMLDAGLVDEVLLYLAPLLLGAGRSALGDGAAATLDDASRWEIAETARCGPDLRIRYHPAG